MQFRRGTVWLAPLLSVVVPGPSHCEPPGSLALTPRVRPETTGGRLELGKPAERFVMMVARVLPSAKPRARVAEAFLYLPQTTERQTVRHLVCVPPPDDLLEDRWGNQIAHFVLGTPAPDQAAHACWMARVSLRDLKANLDGSAPPPSQAVQEAAGQGYLGDSLKYVLSASRIRQQAQELVGTSGRPEDTAAGIHKYLAANLVYERLGAHDDAPKVLARGTGSCSEKAFCWIALARAQQLPARYTGALLCGADYPRYDTVHHRWTEIFLPRWGWLPVDQCDGEFRTFRVRSDKLQLCWCGESEPPMNWSYIARTLGAACDKFVCPATDSADWKQLVELTAATFAAHSPAEQRAALSRLESADSPETIPLLQTLLCSGEKDLVARAAARIFALEPRAGRQIRSFVQSLPTAWETMCDALAANVDTSNSERRYGEWVDLFSGERTPFVRRDLTGWTGDLKQFSVADGAVRNSGKGAILSPYCAGRWYEIEMDFRFTGTGRLALVFADDGRGTNLSIPFRTDAYRKYNSLTGAASKVGGYAAEPGKRQTARILVADDRLWFDFNGKPIFTVRNFAVSPGRIGLRTWGDETKARVEALRVRELTREQADEAVQRRRGQR
jgi:transglutaminase-like putative cysteine protease